jgi:hypothetical protein
MEAMRTVNVTLTKAKEGGKKVTYRREVVDRESGEITETDTTLRLPREPAHIKLYLAGILYHAHLPAWQNKVLSALWQRVELETNEIHLSTGLKKRIVKELAIGLQAFNNALTQLVKAKVIYRVDKGIYMPNPHLFGRGSWENIHSLRLQIKFTPEGQEISGEVTKTKEGNADDDIKKFEEIPLCEKPLPSQQLDLFGNSLNSSLIPAMTWGQFQEFMQQVREHDGTAVLALLAGIIFVNGFSLAMALSIHI